MKTQFSPSFSLLLLLLNSQALAQTTWTPDDILQAWVKAIGGKTALERIQSRTAKGTLEISAASLTAEFEYFGKAPDKRLTKVVLAGLGEAREGYDGKTAWSANPGAGVTDKSGAGLGKARRDAVFHRELKFKEQFEKLEVKGQTKVEGRDAWIIEATPKGEPSERYYFDAQSGLLLRTDLQIEGPGGTTNAELHFEDYRDVDGMKIALRVRMTKPAEMAFTIRLTEVRHNVPIPDSQFARPTN